RLLLAARVRRAHRPLAPHPPRPRDARRDAEPRHGRCHGNRHRAHRRAHLRAWLGHRRARRRRAVADRQCQPEPRSGLHHRQLHGRGVRRRRQPVGHAGRRCLPRQRQQVPRAVRRSGARQDRHPGADHPVHPEASAGPVRPQGPGGRGMMTSFVARSFDRGATAFLVVLGALAVLVPVLNLLVPPSSPFHLPIYLVSLFGKYVCYALLALAIDLIWGYCGILSLGHGAFFALGGYAMGMYLMRQIGARGVYANPILPDFMVFLNWPELPVYWYGFQHFAYAALM